MPSSVNKRGLVPKLRFPEFREAGEWEAKLLGAVCEMQAGKFVAASEISERQSEGLYPCFGGNGLRGYTKAFNQSGRYSLIGRQGALCGNVNLAEGNFYATEHAVVTTPKPGNSTDWLFYNLCLLNLNRFATGQAQPGLSIDVLEKVNCATPKDEKEQQKIADCLASLDARITLEAQKLDTLKTHKKGLMQQLFPAEGETLPKLRFPEFRGAGEWESKPLGKICDVLNNRRKPITSSDRVSGQYPYYGASGIVDYVNDFIFDERLLLIGEDGAKWGPYEKTAFIVEGRYWVNNHAHVLKPFGVNDTLLENYLTMLDLGPFITGAAPPKLTLGKLREVPVPVPSLLGEQQKIADCLSSLDDLITAQTQKLAALKTHKKGLMQQLFPVLVEATA
jgi:type I restriction enzyme S subunit